MSSHSEVQSTEVPDWLNSSFVEEKLRNHYKNDGIEVIEFSIRITSEDLGNFASKIYRASVTFCVPSRSTTEVKHEVSRVENHSWENLKRFILMNKTLFDNNS